MTRLIATFGLSDLEQQRLRASLLATAVEMTLLDRIDARLALMASEDVFNILLAAIRARPEMTVANSIKAAAFTGEAKLVEDAHFEQALDWFDRASLALSLSKEVLSVQSRAIHAYEAAEGFARALQCLQNCQVSSRESREWRYWYDEAEAGRQMAQVLQEIEGDEQ